MAKEIALFAKTSTPSDSQITTDVFDPKDGKGTPGCQQGLLYFEKEFGIKVIENLEKRTVVRGNGSLVVRTVLNDILPMEHEVLKTKGAISVVNGKLRVSDELLHTQAEVDELQAKLGTAEAEIAQLKQELAKAMAALKSPKPKKD